MKVELKTITPEWARNVLTLNTRNRPVKNRHLAELVSEMKQGRWKLNGDTIRLNGNQLLDGQHRLMAVVESNVTIQSLVVEDVPSDVFDTIDVGARRSPGDTLTVKGAKNAYRLAAALVVIDKYMTGRSNTHTRYTNTQITNLLTKYPKAPFSIQTQINSRSLIQPAILDACHYLFSQINPEAADLFVSKLLHGTSLLPKDPVYALRERLIQNKYSKSKLSKAYNLALTIKAWNLSQSNTPTKSLSWRQAGPSPEPFPTISNLPPHSSPS